MDALGPAMCCFLPPHLGPFPEGNMRIASPYLGNAGKVCTGRHLFGMNLLFRKTRTVLLVSAEKLLKEER